MIASDWSTASRTRPTTVSSCFGGPRGLGHGDVDEGAHGGERGSQFVRGVGHEPPLAGEGEIEAVQHVVEGVGELLELVVGSVEADPLIEMFLRGAPGRPGDLVERDQDPPSDRPSQDAGHDGGDTETDQGPHEQLMKVVRALVGRAELRCSGEELLALGRQGAW